MKKIIITPKGRPFINNLNQILDHRYLTYLFIKRNISIYYKQTILGPLWFIIQPIFTTIIFSIVFNKIARLDTGSIAPELFYMSGLIIWTYFSDSTNLISNTFIANHGIFNKIYFPRLVIPISQIMTNSFKMLIQIFVFFLLIIIITSINNLLSMINLFSILSLVFYILLTSVLSLGMGLFFSSITAKYKDIRHLIGFGLRSMMFISPIIYPMNIVPDNFKTIIMINPMTAPIQGFRSFIDKSSGPSAEGIVYSIIISLILLLLGMFSFFKVEKKFVDTV